MPVCKAEAHRALELLEDYYSRLDDTEEKELKAAIERVIKIFKSRLFQVRSTYAIIKVVIIINYQFLSLFQSGPVGHSILYQEAIVNANVSE